MTGLTLQEMPGMIAMTIGCQAISMVLSVSRSRGVGSATETGVPGRGVLVAEEAAVLLQPVGMLAKGKPMDTAEATITIEAGRLIKTEEEETIPAISIKGDLLTIQNMNLAIETDRRQQENKEIPEKGVEEIPETEEPASETAEDQVNDTTILQDLGQDLTSGGPQGLQGAIYPGNVIPLKLVETNTSNQILRLLSGKTTHAPKGSATHPVFQK